MSESSLQCCPACGSEHVAWQVHRTGSRLLRHSDREIHWTCRECTHQWSDPLLADPVPPVPSAPSA